MQTEWEYRTDVIDVTSPPGTPIRLDPISTLITERRREGWTLSSVIGESVQNNTRHQYLLTFRRRVAREE